MSTAFLGDIDWHRPWLDVLRGTAATVLAELDPVDMRMTLNAAATRQDLQNRRGLPIRFVPQADLPANVAYETFIHETGGVPTRDNLHDFFNALIWLSYPKAKAQLNALQAAAIAETSLVVKAQATQSTPPTPHERGKLRDAATIFDENAALLIVRDLGVVDALRSHRWHEAFVERRSAFGTACEVRLFGHALLEKLVSPYKAITAHAWITVADADYFSLDAAQRVAWLDHQLALQLQDDLTTASFTPLPVLGVPGWWEDQDEDFYRDVSVFRPKRRA